MRTITASCLPLLLLSWSLGLPCMTAADWPTYRGNHARTAISTETGLLSSWPTGGPPLAYALDDLGQTNTSPVIAGGILYMVEKKVFFTAREAQTGVLKWKVGIKNLRDSTPSIAKDHIILEHKGGLITCLSRTDGKELWHKAVSTIVDGIDDWATKYNPWAQSPLLVGDRLFINVGHPATPMIALSIKDGSVLWRATPTKEALFRLRSYASPLFIQRGSTPLIISHFGNGMAGLHAETGKVLWEVTMTKGGRASLPIGNCAQLVGDLLIGASCSHYGNGPAFNNAFTLSSDGQTMTPAWKIPHFQPVQEGFLAYQGHLYGTGSITWDMAKTDGMIINGQAAADFIAATETSQARNKTASFSFKDATGRRVKKGLLCIDAATGRTVGIRYGLPVSGSGFASHLLLGANGRIIATGASNQNQVWLLEPGPHMQIAGRFSTPAGTHYDKKKKTQVPGDDERWSSPALADGHLYLRLNQLLQVYDLRASN